MKAKLSVFKDNQIIETIEIGSDVPLPEGVVEEYFIGRDEDCHIQLDHQQISRTHAVIKQKSDFAWELEKVTEMGQLTINGRDEQRVNLVSGDLIGLGPFTLNVSIPQEGIITVPVTEPIKDSKTLGDETEILKPDEEQESSDGGETIDEEKEETESIEDNEDNSESEHEGGIESENTDDMFGMGSSDDSGDDESSNFSDSESDGESGTDEYGDQGEMSDDMMGGDMVESDGMDDGDSTKIIDRFAEFALTIFGEHAPYDYYIINEDVVKIGRDSEKCQIVLNDPEVSSVHAIIERKKMNLVLIDQDSGNGTILNGKRINKSNIFIKDEFVIGSTSFTVCVKSDLMKEEENRLMPVDEHQEVEIEEVVEEEVDFMDEAELGEGGGQGAATSKGGLFSKDALKDPAKRKKLMFIGAGLLVLMMFLGEDDQPGDTAKDKANEAKTAKGKAKDSEKKVEGQKKKQKVYTPEELKFLDSHYNLARTYFGQGDLNRSEQELNQIFALAPEGYKNAKQIREEIRQAQKELALLREKEQREKEEALRKVKVDELLKKAQGAVKERRVELANGLFNQILQLDPEQPDVSILKMELDSWKKEEEQKAVLKAQKEAERKRKLALLNPGQTFYHKKEWYKAIIKLEDFLRIQDMDEDLIKKAVKMLGESKKALTTTIKPILGKARSLLEGQDLKGAYEAYKEVLSYDPAHLESLNKLNLIKDVLVNRSRKAYREAIISESLSLFSQAKEKYEEVKQISPTGSEYYIKAEEKLKNYLE